MTNKEIRGWYCEQLAREKQLDAELAKCVELGLEERARRAHRIRNCLKHEARELMTRRDVKTVEARNIKKYGNPLGPTFDELVERGTRKDLPKRALYELIIKRAFEPGSAFNKLAGVS